MTQPSRTFVCLYILHLYQNKSLSNPAAFPVQQNPSRSSWRFSSSVRSGNVCGSRLDPSGSGLPALCFPAPWLWYVQCQTPVPPPPLPPSRQAPRSPFTASAGRAGPKWFQMWGSRRPPRGPGQPLHQC